LFPLTIETTAINEQLISDYLPIFEENGFKLRFNPEKPVGKRVEMLNQPYYKGVDFGAQDVNELTSLIAGGVEDDVIDNRTSKDYIMIKNQVKDRTFVLPKLMATYASKACRTAVMIGTALEKTRMEKVVNQLADIEQPWNCPHGRPTLRHLLDLKEVPHFSDDVV
jgi:DNA mismatch repair protein PMS2